MADRAGPGAAQRAVTPGLQIEGIERGPAVPIELDGCEIDADEGESIASAMWKAGIRTFRITRNLAAEPRGYYCGMGVCFECVVHVEGSGDVRACRTPISRGMRIRTGAR